MSQDRTHRDKLARLGDAMIEDIIATPDAEILAQADPAHIKRARLILADVKARKSIQLLHNAKQELASWRSTYLTSRRPIDRDTAQTCFDRIRNADAAFGLKMTIAARNGDEPTDNDKKGLIEDWDDLQRLEREDTSE